MSNNYSLTTKKSWSATNTDLQIEFDRWGVSDWETNYPRGARLEGFNQSEQDRTVTLRYNKNGKEVNLTMGKQARAVDNLRVLFLAIESMRLNEKRGIGEILESAYLQIAGPTRFDPYQVLKIHPDTELSVAEAVYRSMAAKYHPDAKPSGDAEMFKRITEAINLIREEKGGNNG